MSTLSVSNITDGTDTVETGYVVNGSAKAWVNFNGTGTVAIRDSMNAASLTDFGTGLYGVNFSTSFSSTNYCCSSDGSTSVDAWNRVVSSMPASVSQSRLVSFYSHTDAKTDMAYVFFSGMGDLA